MWLHLLFGVAIVIFVIVTWEFVPPPWAVVVVWFRDGNVDVVKGRITANLKTQLEEIVADEKLTRDWIAVRTDNRLRFSRGLPFAVRQRIRNTVVNRLLE